ncbi:MAG: restriction endonuclease [Thermoplasmata archaeon]|nr:restriction endonuclease [Thermoplasmata archaeon]
MKTNAIYCGDCGDMLMNHFRGGCVDLIYMDPPFFSNKQYEVIWGDGYELRAFEDRWKGGIKNYIAWMEPKLRECHRVLKKTGSIYLHCDWHANAHLRLLMDEIFGGNNFRNEIYWYYYNKMHDYRKKLFARATDTLLFYVKDANSDSTFNMLEEKRDKPVKQLMRKKVDGKMVNVKDEKGHVMYRLRDKRIVDNVWRLSMLQPADKKERYGYPTQKPEHLLERIINASSNPTDVVLDPMCGCGTAIAVAQKLKRRWIGIDVSPTACRLMVKRMRKLKVRITENDVIGFPKTLGELKELKPFEFQNWVCQKLIARASRKKVGDMGIDGWIMGTIPLQVKQSESVGRNVIDNFETAMRRKGKDKGIIVAFSFTKGAYEEVARAKLENGAEIELKMVKEILAEE